MTHTASSPLDGFPLAGNEMPLAEVCPAGRGSFFPPLRRGYDARLPPSRPTSQLEQQHLPRPRHRLLLLLLWPKLRLRAQKPSRPRILSSLLPSHANHRVQLSGSTVHAPHLVSGKLHLLHLLHCFWLARRRHSPHSLPYLRLVLQSLTPCRHSARRSSCSSVYRLGTFCNPSHTLRLVGRLASPLISSYPATALPPSQQLRQQCFRTAATTPFSLTALVRTTLDAAEALTDVRQN
jgi:hypothetical protein